jgi:prophage DNA circulation protein
MARDWLKTLQRASYKGAPFWVESDQESGKRRIVVHEFPMRDIPYLEDLGEGAREFKVTAYVASDAADTEAARVMATCATRGAGVLVLPAHGPLFVRCTEFERSRAKDKHGFIGHDLKFVREGAAGALATVASLANLVFVAAGELAAEQAASFARAVVVTAAPDYVVGTAVSGVETGLAALDATRTMQPVDVAVSATQRDAIEASFNSASEVVATEDPVQITALALSVVEIARDLAGGMAPEIALPAFANVLASVDATVVVAPGSAWQFAVAQNRLAGNTLIRIAALIAYCEAVVRVTLSDRPAGITLRAIVAEYFDEQINALPSDDFAIYYAALSLRDATIEYLSRTILDLAPVVTVTANLSMPSLFWAWRLYADPARSTELVARNRVVHPSFVPAAFEALAR